MCVIIWEKNICIVTKKVWAFTCRRHLLLIPQILDIKLMLLNCGVGEDSWKSLGLQWDPTSPFWRRSTLGFLWKEWCQSWNSSTLATSCEELTHWKRLWCWEGLGAGGEGDDWGWDGWMASLTRWTWVWVNSGRWWWTGRPGVLRFTGSQRVGHYWVTELNWTELKCSLAGIIFQKTRKKSSEAQKLGTTAVLEMLSGHCLTPWLLQQISCRCWAGQHLSCARHVRGTCTWSLQPAGQVSATPNPHL